MPYSIMSLSLEHFNNAFLSPENATYPSSKPKKVQIPKWKTRRKENSPRPIFFFLLSQVTCGHAGLIKKETQSPGRITNLQLHPLDRLAQGRHDTDPCP